MALDKQKILNELGSVMNQLQSADCGCMGKLFSNSGQTSTYGGNAMASFGECRHGCCHSHGCGHTYGHTYNSPCAGEPYTPVNGNPIAMGRCNPSKLYADTYNYLNENLMQPVVKDVYNDLKNLSPANTVMNNPMSGQVGLCAQGNTGNVMAGEMSYSGQSNTSNSMTNGGMGSNLLQNIPNRSGMMGNMAGMGPQIVNMMTGDGTSKSSIMEGQAQRGALTSPMVIDAPNSPHGQVGVTPLNQLSGYNQSQFNPTMEASYSGHKYSNLQPLNPIVQNMYGGNTYNNGQIIPPTTDISQNDQNTQQMGSSNPAGQQMAAAHRYPHGMHTQGVEKFNEMFPGAIQGLGGDLGFDPMTIAIQMNPANQQKAAMDTMQKIMNGSGVNKVLDSGANSAALRPVINGVKAAVTSFGQPPPSSQVQNMPNVKQQIIPNQQVGPSETMPIQNQQINPEITPNQPQKQQYIYTANTANSTLNPQKFHQQFSKQENSIDSRHIVTFPPITESNEKSDPSDSSLQNTYPQVYSSQAMIKDPIFPVDTSKNISPSLLKQKYFEYNTLGQPVEMLPAKMFHSQAPNLPQTLSPQPSLAKTKDDYMKYSNVKSTVSKTALMANKPLGKVPSRSQLQHIYNQYKGSRSFTQQNISAPTQGVSHSDGHIVANQEKTDPLRQAPIERVGDMVPNNAPPNVALKVGQNIGHINGDVPMEKSPCQGELSKIASPSSKIRNGLQDMVYTSYPTSAAWSFHGNNRTPYYPGRCSRHRT